MQLSKIEVNNVINLPKWVVLVGLFVSVYQPLITRFIRVSR